MNGETRLILADSALAGQLGSFRGVDVPIHWTRSMTLDLETLIREGRIEGSPLEFNSFSPFWILCFVSIESVTACNDIINKDPDAPVFCSLVAFGPEELDTDALPIVPILIDYRTSRLTHHELHFIIRKAFVNFEYEKELAAQRRESMTDLLDSFYDQQELIAIGRSLSLEKDTDRLLRSILYTSKKITGADAGSIFIVEPGRDGAKMLRFAYSHTFSSAVSSTYESFSMPLDTTSIAGYVASVGKTLNIPDAYELVEPDEKRPYCFNTSFDERTGYKSRTMLIIPMKNHNADVIGVIQLINSKEIKNTATFTGNEAYEVLLETPADFENKVVPFDEKYAALMEAVAGQAAIALENNRMIKTIESQFEAFVKASVGAIESRDPATSGHSSRVAAICVAMAEAVRRRHPEGYLSARLSDVHIKELELAALLHDFGKVYIDPAVFLKGKKLYPRDMDYLLSRLSYVHRALELNAADKKNEHLVHAVAEANTRGVSAIISDLEEGLEKQLSVLSRITSEVASLNEPRIQSDDPEMRIQKILQDGHMISVPDLNGDEVPILTDYEILNLRVKRGSLNEDERRLIEAHVEYTYTFVSKIPWPPEYAGIPEIAVKHHELLDGSGYPNGLLGEDIPLQARIMTVADIFDALTASDRPYKKALPLEKSLQILREEAAAGKIDSGLVEIFIDEELWRAVGIGIAPSSL